MEYLDIDLDLMKNIDNTVIVCSNEHKKVILNSLNNTDKLYDVSFMTINELIKRYYFNYDEHAISYLMHKYGYKYDIAVIYLNNLYYVEDKNYDSANLNKLVSIKKELIDNNLLIYDDLFIDYIKNRKIIFYKYDLNRFQLNMIKELKSITDVKIIDKAYSKYPHKVYEFKTMTDEVEFVAYKISELISSGIDINSIKLANVTKEYYSSIKRIFGFYNIPVNLEDRISIYGTKVVSDFLDNYNNNIEDTIMKLDNYKGNDIYNSIIDICNKYRWCNDYNDIKDLVIYDLKHTYLKYKKYDKEIEVVDYKDDTTANNYIFLMNFNLGSIPNVYKDEDYISDSIKPSFLENTVEKNKIEKELSKKSIDNIKKLVITYKLKTTTSDCYPSPLVDNYEVERPNIDYSISYSQKNDRIKLSEYLDKLVKYGIEDKNLPLLFNNYDIPYLKYSNKYTHVDTANLYSYLHSHLTLSYSSLEDYNECAFRYYLSHILKLNIFEDNFAAILGSVFHHILEIGLKRDINIDEEINEYLKTEYKDRILTSSEAFFLNKTKKDMLFVLDCIKKQMLNCKLDKVLTEQEVKVNEEGNLTITFTGKIDKLLYKEDSVHTVVAIIDYKTGTPNIELGYLPYGLHLQLPIYLYLASNMGIDNIEFAGIYLQKVMPGIDKIDITGKITKASKLKLEGYSNSNGDILNNMDITYKDSEVIKSLKMKKDGTFYSYSKVLSSDKFDTLIGLTKDEIDKCIYNIESTNFDINPKREDNDKEITACKYCKYKDICFRKPKDVVNIKKDIELKYLGGDDND